MTSSRQCMCMCWNEISDDLISSLEVQVLEDAFLTFTHQLSNATEGLKQAYDSLAREVHIAAKTIVAISAVFAYNHYFRTALLVGKDQYSNRQFFHQQNSLQINKFIQLMHNVARQIDQEATSNALMYSDNSVDYGPGRVNNFALPKGQYPAFTNYPKLVVDMKIKIRNASWKVCKGRTHEEGPIVSIPDTLSHKNKVAEEGDQDHCEPIRSTEKLSGKAVRTLSSESSKPPHAHDDDPYLDIPVKVPRKSSDESDSSECDPRHERIAEEVAVLKRAWKVISSSLSDERSISDNKFDTAGMRSLDCLIIQVAIPAQYASPNATHRKSHQI
ncbi:unnamed protein product [Albugo candida]|uniref:Uncharacterized protein n=1 Tax=Albugo candida TaxID=65357 RepID=A0A024FT51_9STRA|nr:unnamed protein product [Albugo candida]|eukprot:CCI10047.1 unnamed protein product [Albugo candida]